MNTTTLTLGTRQHRTLMGVRCEVSVVGGNAFALVEEGLQMVVKLEQLWSRFIPSSDICRLNQANGKPVWIDARTVTLVGHMIAAHATTHGAFNPTLLPVLTIGGDTRSLIDDKTSFVNEDAHAFDCLDDIHVYADNTVQLPPHMTLDAGGIGKGLAADIVAEHLLTRGAESVCVNLGGDIRVARQKHSTHDWPIQIMSPTEPHTAVCTISLAEGAVATSHINARQRDGRGIEQHIASAAKESPAVIAASVIASTASWAEAWTKYAILRDVNLIESAGLAAMTIDAQHNGAETSTWKEFVR
jgi:thiamine biosynthesis lipoprotein